MINISSEGENFQIILSPNRSLTGKHRWIFIGSIATICLSIATIFFILGATLILPFAGLEIAILSIAFYLNFKWSSQKEVIYINSQEVRIEKGNNKLEFSWKEFRTFTSFVVSKENKDNIQLGFRSKGQTIYIGSFLNFDEKKELKEEVTKIISELNAL